MTPELITALAGILLSLAAGYLPGFAPWYNARSTVHKRMIMLVLLLLVSAGIFTLACTRLESWEGIPCSTAGAWNLFKLFVSALVSNQATYDLAIKTSGSRRKAPATLVPRPGRQP